MNFLLPFYTILSVLAVPLYRELEQQCVHDLEIVILMDVSGGTRSFMDVIAGNLAETVRHMETAFTSVKVGLANFVDKPNVYVGVGTYGAYPSWYVEDWCYDLVSPLTSLTDESVTKIVDAIKGQKHGAGLDMYDAHFEALTRAATDANMGWSLRDSAEDRRLSKLVLMVTDHFGHTGEWRPLKDYVDSFNAPLYCDNGVTKGGFGARRPVPALPALNVWTPFDSEYNEYVELKEKELCKKGELTTEESERINELEEILSPIRVPSIKPFDYNVLTTQPEEHCRFHEYPAYADITQIMNDEEIALSVLLIDMANEQMGQWTVPTSTWEWALNDDNALGKMNNNWKVIGSTQLDSMPETVLGAVAELFPPQDCPTLPPTEEPTTEMLTTTPLEMCSAEDCAGSCCDNLYEIFFDTDRKPTSVQVQVTI